MYCTFEGLVEAFYGQKNSDRPTIVRRFFTGLLDLNAPLKILCGQNTIDWPSMATKAFMGLRQLTESSMAKRAFTLPLQRDELLQVNWCQKSFFRSSIARRTFMGHLLLLCLKSFYRPFIARKNSDRPTKIRRSLTGLLCLDEVYMAIWLDELLYFRYSPQLGLIADLSASIWLQY